MNKQIWSFGLIFSMILLNVNVFAKSPERERLLTIEGPKTSAVVTPSAFKRVYQKNNTGPSATNQSLEEYMDLFVNFKLKVLEAQALGYDTTESFVNEFTKYKEKLAQPYLTDKKKKKELMREAYERKKTAVHASHILVKVDFKKATPEDTLYAYNKAMEIRKRIQKGEPFEKVAKSASDDPSVKRNGGDLGYFTAFKFPYSFESAAYNAEVGELTKPVRTDYGYHIIKVHDKKPAEGKIKVAHIMKFTPQSMSETKKDSVKERIQAIYKKLQQGKDFGTLARKYSDDQRSAKKGGKMPYFVRGKMVPAFENACFSLEENGAISEPVKTRYGWHIIKRINQKERPSYEEMKSELEQKVQQGKRKEIIRESFIQNLKDQYDVKVYNDRLHSFIIQMDSTAYYNNRWAFSAPSSSSLMKIEDTSITENAFATYLNEFSKKKKKKWRKAPREKFINHAFDQFYAKQLINFEKSQLKHKYPEYRNLIKEYHDGILLFNIMDDKVWSKAVKDSTGVREYYESNKDKYMWNKRLECIIYTCPNKKAARKARRYSRRRDRKDYSDEDIIQKIKKKDDVTISVEHKTVEKGNEKMFDQLEWEEGFSDFITQGDSLLLIHKRKVHPKQPKPFKEAEGMVTSDYQDYLEQKWIEELRGKYDIKIHEDTFAELKKQMN